MALGAIGSAVLDLLKVLTPTEIRRLTEFKIGQKGLTKRKLRISSVGDDEGKSSSEVSAHGAELKTSHSNVLPFSRGKQEDELENDLSGQDMPSPSQHPDSGPKAQSDLSIKESTQVFDPLMAFETQHEMSQTVQIPSEIILPNIELTKTEEMLEKAGIMSASKIDHLKKIQQEKEKQGRQSTSIFLILEREKLAKSLSEMKKIEVLQAYKEESLVDIELEKYSNTQDLITNPGSGVLVNRKHY